MKPRTSSNAAASVAYGTMALLVATYIAFVALLMRHDVMPIPVFAGIAAVALAALLFVAKRCSGIQLPVSDAPDIPSGRRAFWDRRGVQRARIGLLPARVSARRLLVGYGQPVAADYRRDFLYGLAPRAAHIADGRAAENCRSSRLCAGRAGALLCAGRGFTADVLARWHIPRLLIAALTAYLCLNPAIVNIMLFRGRTAPLPSRRCFWGRSFSMCIFPAAKRSPRALCRAGRDVEPVRHSAAQRRGHGAGGGHVAADCAAQKWKRLLPSLLIAVLLTLSIRGPLYHAFGIERQRSQLDELFGVPMTILANIYDQAPDSLDARPSSFWKTSRRVRSMWKTTPSATGTISSGRSEPCICISPTRSRRSMVLRFAPLPKNLRWR